MEFKVEQNLEHLINFSNDLVLKGTFDHFQLHQIGTVDRINLIQIGFLMNGSKLNLSFRAGFVT